MKQLRQVVWAEGIPLGQQHLQQWDVYQAQIQQAILRSTQPFAWGLIALEITQDALANGIFRMEKCQAILPGGRFIDYQTSSDGELSLAINNRSGEHVSIYLTLPNNNLVRGLSGYPSSEHSAWVTDYQMIKDEYDHEREREVIFGRLHLQVQQDLIPKDNTLSLKIAELTAQGKGAYQLDKNYIPPVLQLGTSPNLLSLLQRVQELVGAKRRTLIERRENFRGDITEFGQTDLSHFLLLQELNRYYPLLQHYNHHLELHPLEFYQSLISLLGVLLGFGEQNLQVDFPVYQHENLALSFGVLEDKLRELISVVMPSTVTPLVLQRKSDTLYVITEIEALLFEKGSFFIACRLDKTEAVWIDQFQRQVKVGSIADIEPIVAAALPGITLKYTQRPPKKLPVKIGYEYFYLEPQGDFWQKAKAAGNLALFLPYELRHGLLEFIHVEE